MKLATIGLLLLLGASESQEIGTVSPLRESRPPMEEVDRFLRTPVSMASMTLPFSARDGWEFSEITFGIRDGHLMLARYRAESPEGLVEYIDDSQYADVIVEDTSRLPVPVYYEIDRAKFTLRGFTLGYSPQGRAYVDWVSIVGPEGPKVRTFVEPQGLTSSSGCYIETTTVCSSLFCTSSCQEVGADPCDCSGTGFCFVDFQIFRCKNNGGCPGSCIFLDHETCGCFLEDGCIPEQGVHNGGS